MTTATQQPDRLAQREAQMQQAEELLGTMPQKSGVAKGLFEGRFVADWVFPYPQLPSSQRAEVEQAVADLERFCDEHLDPERIDREADIPREVIDGLAKLGVLGMTAPTEFGGRGFSQMGYCRLLEVIGARCSSTAIFVNAHHSIGIRRPAPVRHQRTTSEVAARSGQRPQARRVRPDRARSRLRRRECANNRHAVARRQRLHPQRPKALHHERRNRRHSHRDGPHPGRRQRQVGRHGVSRHARHARLSSRRTADAEAAESAAPPRPSSRSTTCSCRARTSSARPARA